jgi:hypothetical protein
LKLIRVDTINMTTITHQNTELFFIFQAGTSAADKIHCVKAKYLILSCFLNVNQKISVSKVPDYELGNPDLSLPFGRGNIFSLPFHNVQSDHPAFYLGSKADAARS